MKNQIAVIGSAFEAHHVTQLAQTAEQCGCSISFFDSYDSAYPYLDQIDILFAPSNLQSADAVQKAPRLKWFASYFAGVDPLVVPGVLKDTVILTNGSGAYGITIAEHMIMTTLMLLRRYPEYQKIVENGEFRSDLMIGSLYDATILVLGTGDIGSTFANRLRAFMPKKIIGVNRSGRACEAFDFSVSLDKLNEYLPEADIIALTLPATPETDHLISRERIRLMKKNAYLLNVGRGNYIDQTALADALNRGELAGAALDVFAVEPIPEKDPILTAKNILITPHCAGKMTMAYTRDTLVNSFCDNLIRYTQGQEMLHVVNRKMGY